MAAFSYKAPESIFSEMRGVGRHRNLGRSPRIDAISSKAGMEIGKGHELWPT